MLQIQNTYTNTTGRAKFDRVVSAAVWREEILPTIQRILGPSPRHAFARVGEWIVEARGDDEHVHDFFVRNWKPVEEQKADVQAWYIARSGPDEIRALLGLQSAGDLSNYRLLVLESLQDPRYRATLCDPKLNQMDKFSKEEQLEICLQAPAVIYCPELASSLSLNTNYYGQFKSKCVLGPLEEILVRKARLKDGKVLNPEDVWVSLHASCVEYSTHKAGTKTVVMIGPTGGGKSTHAYGLISAKTKNRMHSDDWLFVNAGTREALRAEENFYMRTPMARIYPELGPLFLSHPLENLPENKIDSLNEEIQKLKQHQSTRVLMDPKKLAGENRLIDRSIVTDLLIIKRDYQDASVLRRITPDEMMTILTERDNVSHYMLGKTDEQGREILQQRSTEVYYNPYLCVCEAADCSKENSLDGLRAAVLKHLAGQPGLQAAQFNARLPVPQAQFCLRRYLEGGVERVQVENKRGTMILEFWGTDGSREWVALDFRDPEHVEPEAWSEGGLDNFWKRYEALGVRSLFGAQS